jgi:hypothetical protein
MQVTGFDERYAIQEGLGANFVVSIFEGGDVPGRSWSVDSLLLTDADVPQVLHWLHENLPTDSCWSLGVVRDPEHPTAESDLKIAWIVGADVLNRLPEMGSRGATFGGGDARSSAPGGPPVANGRTHTCRCQGRSADEREAGHPRPQPRIVTGDEDGVRSGRGCRWSRPRSRHRQEPGR